jgi:hypothetical protein
MKWLVVIMLWVTMLPAFAQVDDRLARQYYDDGNYEKAAKLYDGLYEKSGQDIHYKGLLDSYLQLEAYKEALKLISKHQKKRKQQPAIYMIDEIVVLLKTGDAKSAEKVNQELLLLVAQNPTLAFQLSKYATDLGMYKLGLAVLNVAEKADTRLNFHFQKAMLYAELGDLDNMYASYIALIDQSPTYVNYVQGLIQRNMEQDENAKAGAAIKPLLIKKVQEGQNIVFNELLIWIFIQEKDYYNAFIQEKALDKRLNRNQAEIFDLAVICRQDKAFDAAYRALDYIIEMGSKSAFYEDALLEKAFTQMDALLHQSTITQPEVQQLYGVFEQLHKQFDRDDRTVVLLQKMAYLQAYHLNNRNKASELLVAAIDIQGANPKEVAACKLDLGDVLLLEGAYYDAILYYAQVEKALPDIELGQEAKFRKARVAYFQGDFEWAKAQFDVLKESTSKLISNDAIRMSLLIGDHTALDTSTAALELYAAADLLYYRGLHAEAIKGLDLLAAIYPVHPIQDHVLFLRAECYAKLRLLSNTVADLEKLLAQHEESVLTDQARFKLGLLFELDLKDLEKARFYYEALLEKNPDSIKTAEARKRYRALRGDFNP